MRPPSPAAAALARRLVDVASTPRTGEAAPAPLAATERALEHLADSLVRWFGPFGYHTLLARAVAQARREHPALAAVTVAEAGAPALTGLADAAARHGAEAAASAALAVLTAVIALLGRVVGDDMVLYLVEPRMDASDPPADRAGDTEPRPS